jgi:hypothetical protein
MAVSSLKNKSKLSTLTSPFDIDLGGMIPLSTVTVGSGGAANVEFTSIPATYTHLQIRGITQSNRATFSRDEFAMTFNSDTGTNYSWHSIYGSGTSASSQKETTINRILGQDCVGANGWWGNAVIDILDYANTNKNKTVRFLAGLDTNNAGVDGYNGALVFTSGNWRNTNAITSIKFAPTSGTQFNQYSHFALYGIKGAGA